MVNQGVPWTNISNLSVAKLNAMNVVIANGSDVDSYSRPPGSATAVLTTSGNYEADSLIIRKADDSGFYYVSGEKHYHDADTRKAGGFYSDIRSRNIAKACLFDGTHATLEKYFRATVTAGAITNDIATGSILLTSSTTTNGMASLRICGIGLDYGYYSIIQAKMKYTGATTANFGRWGVEMEPLDTSNNNTNPKYGIEGCAATSGGWYIVSANGDTVAGNRTQQDGSASMTPANPVSYRVEHIPSNAVRFTEGVDVYVDKTTTLPDITKGTSFNNIVNLGVKTTDTAAKTINVYGQALFGKIKDVAWL